MNPDTNKFEMLREMTESEKQLEKMFNKMSGQLVRPNGELIPKHWSTFTIGENYVINEYTFKCAYIGESSILFEPVGAAIKIKHGWKPCE